MQGNRLTAVLLHFLHLLDRHVELACKLIRRGFAAKILQHLTLHTRQLVDHFDHVHRHANGTRLVSHGSGDGLTNPPRGIGGELKALLPVELLDGANQTEVAFLNQIQEQHATAGVTLSQRNHKSQIGFQQVVLGPPAIVRSPLELTLAFEVHLVGFGVQQVLGIQTGFDTLGQIDFLFRIQQAHTTDLLQVILDRISSRTRRNHTTLRIAGWGQILIIIVITHHESALFLRLFRLFAFFLILVVIIFRFGFLVVVEVILVIRIDVIEIGVEIVKIGVVYLSVLIVKCIILERLLLLGRGALLRGSLARGLRCGGFLRRTLLRGGLARGGFLRGGGLFGQISLFHACRRFLGGQTYPPIDPASKRIPHGPTSGKGKSSTM